VSNFEATGKLVDVDNHDEDVESAFGDRDVAWEDISNCRRRGYFHWCVWAVGCSVRHQ
jgi:hypothetical protein